MIWYLRAKFLGCKTGMAVVCRKHLRVLWDCGDGVLSTVYCIQGQGSTDSVCSYPSLGCTNESILNCYNKQIIKFQWLQIIKFISHSPSCLCGCSHLRPSTWWVRDSSSFSLGWVRKERVEKTGLGPGEHITSAHWWGTVTWPLQEARNAGKWEQRHGSHVPVTIPCYGRGAEISGEQLAVSFIAGAFDLISKRYWLL